ncbi:hypothetical protein ABZ178_35355 [Streptomyces massasporeus]|uniref:hypothetical protein n=1 Tax=Streptomyces massasporeus TaxID=67324 RepID=UPI001678ECE3|nr:hypothetical protein [Streptomyces massasporeus]GGV88372.1 hypothetical protein GCM10010228_72230 [Streptomyces massasporeus]
MVQREHPPDRHQPAELFGKNIAADEITTVTLNANLFGRSAFEDPDNWNLDSATVEHSVSGGPPRELPPAVRTTPFRFTRSDITRHLRGLGRDGWTQFDHLSVLRA